MQLEPIDIAFRAAGLADAKATVVVENAPQSFWISTSGSGVSRFDFGAQTWETFTKADGLADTDVRSMLHTAAGDLWFGTANGASYYSPSTRKWRSFFIADGLPNNSVWSLLEDSRGQIWLGTNGGGLSCYNPATAHWQTYTRQDGLAGNIVLALLEDTAGHIWVGTKTGLSRLNPGDGQWLSFYQQDGLANDQVRSLIQDDSGYIWIGTVAGLSRYQPLQDSWHNYGTKDGLGSDYIQALTYRTGGRLWAGTRRGVSAYHAGTNRWTTLTQEDGLTDNEVWGLLLDSEDRLWAATWGGGVSLYHTQTGRWDTYTAPVEFADTYALAVIKSGETHVWIGTYGAVSRYAIDSGAWLTLSSAEGLPNDNVQTLAQDREDNLWIGTSDGLILYRPEDKSWSTYSQADGLVNNNVGTLLFAGAPGTSKLWHGLWIGTAGGLCRYRPETGDWQTITEQGLATADVRSLLLDTAGNFWIGTTQGLVVCNVDGAWQRFDCADGLLNLQVNALAEDATGCIWIGTEGGLNALAPTTGQWQSFTRAQGLANNKVRALLIDGDNLWVACASGGCSCYNVKHGIWQQLDGLGSDDLSSLAVDGAANLWIASAGGGMTWLSRHGAEAGFIQTFTAGMQLFARQFWAFSEQVALGRPDAIAVNRPSGSLAEARVFTVAHAPLLTGTQVNDKDLLWAASDEQGLSLIVLDSDQRTTVSNLPSRHVTSLSATGGAADNGDAWVGTAAGLSLVRRDSLRAQLTMQYPQIPCGPISGLAAVNDQEVYAGFSRLNPLIFANRQAAQTRLKTGVWHRTPGGDVIQLAVAPDSMEAFVNSTIHNMAWSPQSGLWVATSAGVFHRGQKQSDLHSIQVGGLAGCSITQVAVAPNGDVYSLVDTGGGTQSVILLHPATGQTVQWTQTQHSPARNSFTLPASVSAIAVDHQGRLWVSSGRYLYATPNVALVQSIPQ